ncbi:MAG: hypothetical protein K0S55_74, partial [Clostridia bacterium]|nr:hypothetical protein [Clostridia bacterium]
MIKKIQNSFLINYLLMFIISILIALFALLLFSFANDLLEKTLVKNKITAKSIMKDDYKCIDASPVIKNGGGVQVINTDYDIIFTEGLDTFTKDKLTVAEFT